MGAVFGAVAGLPFSDVAMGIGAAIGAGAGFVAGAALDAWASHS